MTRSPIESVEGLDAGIAEYVRILNAAGVETYESCQGGQGHNYAEPAVRFHGNHAEGYRALAVALECQLPVSVLSRFWSIQDGEPVGPSWQLTFWRQADA